MIEIVPLVILVAICIFICWRVDKDCRAVEDAWKQALDRMK